MKQWDSIVVGIDFSDSSKAALREAARLARWQDCTLHVTHVIALEKSFNPECSESSSAISTIRDQVHDKLKGICLEEIEKPPHLEFHIMVGHPFKEICQLINDIKSDLLVLGSYGHSSNPQHTGTIAAKCVRKAAVPVLLIRQNHTEEFKNIVAALDFSETSERAAKYAAEIAAEHGANLHLVHIYQPILNVADYAFCDLTSYMDSTSYQQERNSAEVSFQRHSQAIQALYPNLIVHTSFVHNSSISRGLLDYINSHKIDLAVLGTRGRTGVKSLLLGTTAEGIIHSSPVSILAVKPKDFSYQI